MNPEDNFYTLDRMLAHDGITDSSLETLLVMYNMNDAGLQAYAVAHPNFPFNLRFLYELKKYPQEVKIHEMSCVTSRAEDYKKFLKDNKLTETEISNMPKEWLIALLEK